MEVAICWTVEPVVANMLPHYLVEVAALALSLRVVLPLGTSRYAQVVLPVHVEARLADASSC